MFFIGGEAHGVRRFASAFIRRTIKPANDPKERLQGASNLPRFKALWAPDRYKD
jgi:hypothetical protein